MWQVTSLKYLVNTDGQTLLTDNGPCYASHEFKQLMLDMSVNHITSSPHYPQSNGLAEKYVDCEKLIHQST